MSDYHPMPPQLGDQTESDLYRLPVRYREDIRHMVARAYSTGHRDGWLYGIRTTSADAEALRREAVAEAKGKTEGERL